MESQIRIQKERNNNKKEMEEQRRKNNLEENVKHLGEMNKIKMTRLEQQNKSKIDKLIEDIKNDYDKYMEEYENKNRNNDLIQKNNILDQEDYLTKENLLQYSKELESQLELSKNSLKNEYEQKLAKEIENLKNNILSNTDDDSQQFSENKKEFENDYYTEVNNIKKENKEAQNKLNETLKNIIEKNSTEFDSIKNKEIDDINKTLKEIKEKINQINKDEEINNIIEDYLSSDLISKKRVIMSKYNSLVNMSEGEYINNKLMLKYYIDIINSINQKLSINQKRVNIDEILSGVNNVIENYKLIYEKEKNGKLFPFLFDAFNKVMNLMSNDDNMINIIDSSIYGQNILIDNNITKLNETMNNTNININMNQNKLSLFSPRKNTNNQILNKTFSNLNTQRYNIVPNNLFKNNNQTILPKDESLFNININIDSNKISIPEIQKQILENLSKENLQKYNIITDFLINESKNITEELNLYSQKKNSENKISILYQSGEFSQYNNILNRICQEENDKTNQYFRNINSKSKIYEFLKKNIKDNYAFIEKYYDKINIVDSKFNQIMNNIEEYKNNFYGMNNIFASKNNSYYKNNIDNMLNNTFNLGDYKSNNYNKYFNEISFVSTMYNSEYRNTKNYFV